MHNNKQSNISRLGEGTVFEGILRCKGDVEIAGEFKGELHVDGAVILHADLHSDIAASSVRLVRGTLTGNVTSAGMVSVSKDAALHGNVTASQLDLGGTLEGDVTVSGSAALQSSACLRGSIRTPSMSMQQGAAIDGHIEMK